MGKITAERVSWPERIFFFTVLGSNECANHVSFH